MINCPDIDIHDFVILRQGGGLYSPNLDDACIVYLWKSLVVTGLSFISQQLGTEYFFPQLTTGNGSYNMVGPEYLYH